MRSLRHVLNVRRQADPGVLAFLVDREAWLGEARLGECANRNDQAVFSSFNFVAHRCATRGAKAECALASLIPDTDVLPGFTFNRDALPVEASLSTKNTSGSALACETVADRNTNRIFNGRRRELPTAASGDSCAHEG